MAATCQDVRLVVVCTTALITVNGIADVHGLLNSRLPTNDIPDTLLSMSSEQDIAPSAS